VPLDGDALIELSRANASRPLAQRRSTSFLAIGFFATAIGMLALPAHRGTSLLTVLICMFCYAVASRVRFEFGGVFAVPTQPIFVAMWFLVPPRMLPVVICASLVLAELPDFVRRRTPLDHLALYVISSWFSVGPALVIFLWAAHAPRWQSAPLYAAALGAQFVFEPMKRPDGKIMHAELRIGDSVVMISDASERAKATSAMVHVYVPNVDAVYQKALKAGGTSVMEPADMFYGDRSGGVKDPAGNQWHIGTHVEDVSPAELKKRAAEFMKQQTKAA